MNPLLSPGSLSEVRKDFPILNRVIHQDKPLVYLDSAATSQKPESVIRAMDQYYRQTNANIHRGVHQLAEEATADYESARQKVARFIGATSSSEVIFTRNTTESINLVAQTWGRRNLAENDLVILTEMEHHSNLVPWQMLASEKNLRLEFIPVTDDGELNMEEYSRLLGQQPRLVAVTHMSNVLGTINPVNEMVKLAKSASAVTLIDAAQSIPHLPVSVQDLGADFIAFSAHKMLGPTGIGALWGRASLLDEMPPFLGGGDMIKKVYLRSYTANDLPHKFEAGTPAIAEAIGFGAAVDYLNHLGMALVADHEKEITRYAFNKLTEIDSLRILGPSVEKRGGVVAFTFGEIHPHDIAQILDSEGVAVRAGHHCAMPLHDRFGIPASTRASFYLYTTHEDIDRLAHALKIVTSIFG